HERRPAFPGEHVARHGGRVAAGGSMTFRTVTAALLLTFAWTASAQEKRYAPPRTPWGHPDLQGVWTSDDARTVPLQRPVELGDRRLLTDEEFEARKRRD